MGGGVIECAGLLGFKLLTVRIRLDGTDRWMNGRMEGRTDGIHRTRLIRYNQYRA